MGARKSEGEWKGWPKGDFPIPSTNCWEGAELSLTNTIKLLKDAKLLYEQMRYAAASCLGVFAVEEAGKGIELAKTFEKGGDLSKEEWFELSSGRGGKAHRAKTLIGWKQAINGMMQRYPTVQRAFSSNSPLDSKYARGHRIWVEFFQWLKQEYLYVNWTPRGWSNSTMLPDREQMVVATHLLTIAFEASKTLAQELKKDLSDIEQEHNKLTGLATKRMSKVPNHQRAIT